MMITKEVRDFYDKYGVVIKSRSDQEALLAVYEKCSEKERVALARYLGSDWDARSKPNFYQLLRKRFPMLSIGDHYRSFYVYKNLIHEDDEISREEADHIMSVMKEACRESNCEYCNQTILS